MTKSDHTADSIVVTADDTVAEQHILEKPGTKKENLRMLEELNGKKRQFIPHRLLAQYI